MSNLVNAVFPNFPEDRTVKESPDRMVWYKIVLAQKLMYVPTVKILRSNPMELDKYIEAVNSFAHLDFNNCGEFDWSPESLKLHEFSGKGCIDGLATLESFMDKLPEDDNYVSCDIETRNVEWEGNRLLSIGFSVNDNTALAFYDIPIKGAYCDDPNDEVLEAFQKVFDRTDVRFTWHNGKFDCGRLEWLCNLKARVDEDTMLLHYVGINERKGTHGLKDLGQLYLQSPAWDDELDERKRTYCRQNKVLLRDFHYDLIPIEILIPYMQRDCIATRRLLKKFKSLQRKGSEFIYTKLIEASNAYKRLELNGFGIDVDYLEELEYELETKLTQANKQLAVVSAQAWDSSKYAYDTGAKIKLTDDFNPKSPKQLKWMIEHIFGFSVDSTDAATIEYLTDEVESGRIENHLAKDFMEAITDVRKFSKHLDTFVQGTRDGLCRDFRIRGTFNLHGTETGRLSSTKPNMQNIPRDKSIKNLYSAAPGTILLQMDYSQAELRVLGMLSGDPWLIQVYKDGKDLHDAVAIEMFGPDFNKEQRNMAKTINFGIAYGRGPSSIAENFGKTMSEAQQIINNWFKPMPLVREFINKRRQMARKGEPCVTILGRERHFVITDSELYHIENEYINTPVQSVASDFTVLSLLEIDKYIREKGYEDKVKIVSNVHDSIILQVAEENSLINEMAIVCKSLMASTPLKYVPDCPVPFKADVEVGYGWGDMYSWWQLEEV